jgi:putative ABC transport system permease protein
VGPGTHSFPQASYVTEADLDSLMKDIRYAVRTLQRARGFTAVAVLTLAIGIGANTALFSVVNGVLLNPLPYPHPGQLVAVAEKFPPFPESSIAYPNFLDWVRMNHAFERLAAYRQTDFNLRGMGETQPLKGVQISADFFPLLGVKPVLGRNFFPQDDRRGAAPVVMLSGRFWRNKFAGSTDVLGKVINLDGTGYTVIGVVPENFYFCCESMNFELGDVYVPIGAVNSEWVTSRDTHPGIRGVGRMNPGVAIEKARADLNQIALNLAKTYPETNKGAEIVLTPLRQRMVQGVQSILFVLLAAVGFVLLIACANVANLLLARSMGRAREFAIRSVLGATQTRVVRQLLTESVLLGLGGGVLGLVLAAWGTQAGLAVLPQALPRAGDVRIDPRVLLFTLGVSVVAGVLFGLTPAIRTSRPNLHDALKEGGRGTSGTRHRAQAVFVVAELALAVVLLIGAGLTVRSLVRLWNVDHGYNAQNVLTFSLALPPSVTKAAPDQFRAMLRQLPERVAQIPGIQAASVTDASMPLADDWEEGFFIEGHPKPASKREMPQTLLYIVSPTYLRVMGIPLLRGRFFTPDDTEKTRRVVVIDEDFARKYFPNQDPIGQSVELNTAQGDNYAAFEIIGVVGHIEEWGVDSKIAGTVRAQLYMLADQIPDGWLDFANKGAGLVVRTQAPNYPSADTIRSAIAAMNSEQAAYDFRPMNQLISKSLASRRFAMILLSVFGVIALFLASIGIYGVMSYVAGQRTHEIGVRMALGAGRKDVLGLVLADAARMTFAGVPIGLIAAAGLTQLMRSLLFGVSAGDPLTYAVVAVLLSAVALLACYIPARRAMRVDPMVALRYE